MFNLDYSQKAEEIEKWLAEIVAKTGMQDAVVAVSGGVDSAVSLYLAVRTLGKEHVYAILLPHGKLSEKALLDGRLVVRSAGLIDSHIFVRDVQPGVHELLQQVKDKNLIEIRRGNMMARVRMMYLFDLAKQLGALVVGTENKSEHLLGYFTRFGDEASDIEPIRSLYKTQVWEMAKYVGVPVKIIEKEPSANLWESQTDEKEFGFSYLDADKVLYMHFEEHVRNGDIVAAGIPEQTVRKVLEFVAKNDFKHHVPYIFE